MARAVLCFGLVSCGGLAGCVSARQERPTDPLVQDIVKEAGKKRTPGPAADAAAAAALEAFVVEAIPLQTPLAQARSVMEHHGFSCWGGVRDDKGTCLNCLAWRRTSTHYGDRVEIRLYYENGRVVKVAVAVDRGAWYGWF